MAGLEAAKYAMRCILSFVSNMDTCVSAPLLSRVKSWQLLGLGLSGWCALYSAALISWGGSSFRVGNTQGGCFAAAMALASIEVRRYKKTPAAPPDPFQWASGITTEVLNLTLANSMQRRDFRVEPCQALETELGFGVRVINAGRAMVFETSRWQERVVNVPHAQAADENRKSVCAALAVIVTVGDPDEDTRIFAKAHPVRFLGGKELKALFDAEIPVEQTSGTPAGTKNSLIPKARGFFPWLTRRGGSATSSSQRRKSKQRRRNFT